MHLFKRIFAVFIGLVFLFSGVVKLIDPVGTGLIFTEYFSWMHIDFLRPIAKAAGFALSLLEAFAGIGLLSGLWRRFTAMFATSLTVFFTLVSIALVIFNPVMDCGCFGEFIHLSHKETLIKNLFLCGMCVFAFTPMWDLGLAHKMRLPAFIISVAMLLTVAVYSWVTIPYFDFTAYKPSVEIVTEDSDRTGDDTATLSVWDQYGNDMSWDILDGDVAIISVYEPQKLGSKSVSRLAQFAASAYNMGFTPYVLATDVIDVPGVDSYLADYKSLITLNRSNGGVTLLEDGTIYSKRSINNLYSDEKLQQISAADKTEYYVRESTVKAVSFQAFAVLFFLVFLL